MLALPIRQVSPLPCIWEADARLPLFDFEAADGTPCSAPAGTLPVPGMGVLWFDPNRGWCPGTVLRASASGKTIYMGDDTPINGDVPDRRYPYLLEMLRGGTGENPLHLGKDGRFRPIYLAHHPPVIFGCRLALGDPAQVLPGRDPAAPYHDDALWFPAYCALVDGRLVQVGGAESRILRSSRLPGQG